MHFLGPDKYEPCEQLTTLHSYNPITKHDGRDSRRLSDDRAQWNGKGARHMLKMYGVLRTQWKVSCVLHVVWLGVCCKEYDENQQKHEKMGTLGSRVVQCTSTDYE